jgi:hypothetical protein
VINKKLLNFDKRIEYSKSRVDIIKALNAHKDNKFKNEIKRLVDLSAIHKPNSNSTAIEHDIDEKKEYKNQLDQVNKCLFFWSAIKISALAPPDAPQLAETSLFQLLHQFSLDFFNLVIDNLISLKLFSSKKGFWF